MITPPHLSRGTQAQLAALLLILLACALRLGGLGSLGLSYDEAATALMARAAPGEIIRFHWQAAFEHPPLWQLLMHGWSRLAGQSEFALRFLPALAGTLIVPLSLALARRLWPEDALSSLAGASLVAIGPTLVYYSQEARMYSLVVALGMGLLLLALRIVRRPSPANIAAYVLLAWAMTWLHYYSALLLAVLGVYAVVEIVRGRRAVEPPGAHQGAMWLLAAGALAVVPLALWLVFAPGFRDTLVIVTESMSGQGPQVARFLDALWRDLAYGSLRWQPQQAVAAYLLLPAVLLGLGLAAARRDGWLLSFLVVAPVAVSAWAFDALATRYILFVLPPLLVAAGLGIGWLARRSLAAGAVLALLALAPSFLGLAHYWGAYQKSAYREMAQTLAVEAGPADLVLLEAPRQHLLWKYYGPGSLAYEPIPLVHLPANWPVNAPPVVPEETDDQLQRALRGHASVWLVLSAENEVDAGEFVQDYLRAVSYRMQCRDWLDVRLCRFRGPAAGSAQALQPSMPFPVEMGDGLVLDGVRAAALEEGSDGMRLLPVELQWRVQAQPALDRKVALRLETEDGRLLAQADDRPIGPLLPLPAWNAGDRKPGYFVLEMGPEAAPVDAAGRLRLRLSLYDPGQGASSGPEVLLELPPAP